MLDHILLTNDDGIDAPGLKVLEGIAAELAREVWVVAPEHDQSGVSHAVSLHHPVRVTKRGERRYSVLGTPGDCAVIGISHLLRDRPPALCLSGVNRGANLGVENVYSGTVGGAMTAMMLGASAIALSQEYADRANVPWDTAATLGAGVVRRLLEIGWDQSTCLNVNFPNLPAAEVGPLTLARQGAGLVQGMTVDTRTDPRGFEYHWIMFRRGPREQGPESDIDALDAGKVVVTPLRYDRTDERAYQALAKVLPK
ncbi:MAG TPA: 5'/3'-nucleotidase SurE [Stellaceae bacterium]|jgi:5'-nucleotidase|nr:5'/3'-nucleotidase SurE [Stellaceae bacterium]